jgi:hypothetical protein
MHRNSLAYVLAGYSDEELRRTAWENAAAIGDGSYLRIDCDGHIICWPEYGLRSLRGWQVDHIVAKALGGPDVPWNVRARHWDGNARAGGHLGNALADIRR